jgi:uridine kinase
MALTESKIAMIGIDGVDGAGKTYFAGALAEFISDIPVIRASVDSFHNPRRVRYQKGRDSPEGFFEDSFNYELLKEYLLDPLTPNGSKEYRNEAFDYKIDEFVDVQIRKANVPSLLIFDGIFLHRPELSTYWDYSIFLDVSKYESVRRCIEREQITGLSSDPDDPAHQRYVVGQEIYLQQCDPISHATRVINNENSESPFVVG